MRVVHVTGSISRLGGGIPPVIWALAEHGRLVGVESIIVALEDEHTRADIAEHPDTAVRTSPIGWPQQLGWSSGMPAVLDACNDVDVVHSHGLWKYPGKAAREFAERRKLPLVVSPHGMLEPWALARSRWKKRAAGWLFENRNLASARALHATADMEAAQFRAIGLGNPISVVPLGLDIEPYRTRPAPSFVAERWPQAADRHVLLFLSRVHPKKGLVNLAQAWSRLAARFPDWHLLIAGPDEGGHAAEIQNELERLGVAEQATLTGPVYGEDKLELFAAAELFVLPTFSENFGIVIAESLASGTPVITTRATPWERLEGERCGWWIDTGVEPLVRTLEAALGASPAEREAMGARGRQMIESDFTWPTVAARMAALYAWASGGEATADLLYAP